MSPRRRKPASIGVADPCRKVSRFQGPLGNSGQVSPDGVQIHGVLQPGRERRNGLVGVSGQPQGTQELWPTTRVFWPFCVP
jgi:hypothetical protein